MVCVRVWGCWGPVDQKRPVSRPPPDGTTGAPSFPTADRKTDRSHVPHVRTHLGLAARITAHAAVAAAAAAAGAAGAALGRQWRGRRRRIGHLYPRLVQRREHLHGRHGCWRCCCYAPVPWAPPRPVQTARGPRPCPSARCEQGRLAWVGPGSAGSDVPVPAPCWLYPGGRRTDSSPPSWLLRLRAVCGCAMGMSGGRDQLGGCVDVNGMSGHGHGKWD